MARRTNVQPSSNTTPNGFDSLLGVHTMALAKNSEMIARALEELGKKGKTLSETDKKALRKIKSELTRIDSDLSSIGE